MPRPRPDRSTPSTRATTSSASGACSRRASRAPEVRKRVASPDETLIGCTVAHSSSCSCCGDSLNASASASSMFTFSDDVATTTLVQPSSAKSPSPRSPPSGSPPVQAARAIETAISAAPAAVARAPRRPLAVGIDGASKRRTATVAGGEGPWVQSKSRADAMHDGFCASRYTARSASRPTSAIAVCPDSPSVMSSSASMLRTTSRTPASPAIPRP